MKQNSKPIFGIFEFFSSGPWIIRYSAKKKKYSDSIFGFQNFNIRIRLRSAEYSVFGSNTRIRIDIPAPDIRNQLISSGNLVIPITKCLISKRKRRTELVNEYQALHQDVQLELKSLRIVFEHQDNLPAVLSKLRSNTKKKSQSRRRAEKRRLVNIGEATVGRTDEEASTERVN